MYNNGITPALMQALPDWVQKYPEALLGTVKTPLGLLVAYKNDGPEHPGIYIDIVRGPKPEDCYPLTLVEYTNDDLDTEVVEHIVTRVWKDVCEEEYTSCVAHNLIGT